jgi:hypothetical protein
MDQWRKQVVILIAYTMVALAMTFPLVLNLGSTIPGVEGDAPSFVWAMGWFKTALERGINPFRSDFVFYPLGGATQLLWATSLIAFVSIPFQSVFGLIATYNLFYLAVTVITAWGTYLLAEDVLRHSPFTIRYSPFDATPLPPFQTLLLIKFIAEQRRLASRLSPLAPFIAGLVFAFAPLRLGYGLGFFNLFNTELVPFYVLLLLRAMREHSWRDAVLAGILLGLNAYIDFQIAAFLILFSGVYAIFDFFLRLNRQDVKTPRNIFDVLRVSVSLWFIIGFISLVVAAPILALVANDFAAEGGNYIRVFPLKYSADRSYDALAYVVPNAWSSLYSNVPKIPGVNAGVDANDGSARSPDRQAFTGYIVLGLTICAAITQWRRARFWILTAIIFALLSWGPALHFLGRDLGVPMPYIILHEIPILNHIRIPMRYGIMVMFALAMLAAIAIHGLQLELRNTHQAHLHRTQLQVSRLTHYVLRFSFLFLPLFILAEFANLPFPLQSFPIPRVYSIIAQQPGDMTVLEIPSFNWRYAASTEVYQAMHGKRILRAYTNRIAPDVAEYAGFRGTPIVTRSLRILEGAEDGVLTPDEIAEDKRARDEVVRFYDLRYAVVHRQWLNAAQAKSIEAYLSDVLNARAIFDEGDTIAYEIPRAPANVDAVKIDLRESVGQMYAGRGWHFQYPPANWDNSFNFVWETGTKSEIYFRGAPGADKTLTLHAFTELPERVVVVLNGTPVGTIDLVKEWRDYRVTLPGHSLQAGMNRIELQYAEELVDIIGVTTITIE